MENETKKEDNRIYGVYKKANTDTNDDTNNDTDIPNINDLLDYEKYITNMGMALSLNQNIINEMLTFNDSKKYNLISNIPKDIINNLTQADDELKKIESDVMFKKYSANPHWIELKENLGKIQSMIILTKINNSDEDCTEIVTLLNTSINNKIEMINQVLDLHVKHLENTTPDDSFKKESLVDIKFKFNDQIKNNIVSHIPIYNNIKHNLLLIINDTQIDNETDFKIILFTDTIYLTNENIELIKQIYNNNELKHNSDVRKVIIDFIDDYKQLFNITIQYGGSIIENIKQFWLKYQDITPIYKAKSNTQKFTSLLGKLWSSKDKDKEKKSITHALIKKITNTNNKTLSKIIEKIDVITKPDQLSLIDYRLMYHNDYYMINPYNFIKLLNELLSKYGTNDTYKNTIEEIKKDYLEALEKHMPITKIDSYLTDHNIVKNTNINDNTNDVFNMGANTDDSNSKDPQNNKQLILQKLRTIYQNKKTPTDLIDFLDIKYNNEE